MNLLHYFTPLLLTITSLGGHELLVRSPSGEPIVINVEDNESFSTVMDRLQRTFETSNEYFLDFDTAGTPSRKMKKAKQQPIRNYNIPVSASEKKDVAFVVNTLGMSSLLSIATSQSDLKAAGDRIDHLHPLRFLMCIFTDEQMKASMQAMKDRSWVWVEFVNGVKNTMEYESSPERNNIKPEFIYDFAAQVGINPDLIIPAINKHQWRQLVVILINNIPRGAQANRYDS